MSLQAALEVLNMEAPHLLEAHDRSSRRIEAARAELAGSGLTGHGVDLVAFGSLARREATLESDFDYLVLVDGIPERASLPSEVLALATPLRTKWALEDGHDVREPGRSGIFGAVVGAFDLIEQIGLERDTNHSLTRRMLLLEESVSLLNPEMRRRAVLAALDRYLRLPGVEPERVPRYLMNDVIRYWRTISVDYQAKANAQGRSGLRYLKLIIPRKIQFASMLMSLLLVGKVEGHLATPESLSTQLDLPPLLRLMSGHAEAPEHVVESLKTVVRVADHYLEKSSDGEWREAIGGRPSGDSEGSPEFEMMKRAARELQDALEVIFFDWDLIAVEARSKLVF